MKKMRVTREERSQMRKVGQCLAICLLVCQPLANAAVLPFDAGRKIVRNPDVVSLAETCDTIRWFANESVELRVIPRRGANALVLSTNWSAVWTVADETGSVRLNLPGEVEPTCVRFAFAPGEGAIAEDAGELAGYVSLFEGTDLLGVIDRHRVVVDWQPGVETVPVASPDAWEALLERFRVRLQEDFVPRRVELEGVRYLVSAALEEDGRAVLRLVAEGTDLPPTVEVAGTPCAIVLVAEEGELLLALEPWTGEATPPAVVDAGGSAYVLRGAEADGVGMLALEPWTGEGETATPVLRFGQRIFRLRGKLLDNEPTLTLEEAR